MISMMQYFYKPYMSLIIRISIRPTTPDLPLQIVPLVSDRRVVFVVVSFQRIETRGVEDAAADFASGFEADEDADVLSQSDDDGQRGVGDDQSTVFTVGLH